MPFQIKRIQEIESFKMIRPIAYLLIHIIIHRWKRGTERNVKKIEKEGVENAHTRKFIIRLNNKCGIRRADIAEQSKEEKKL